MNDILRLMQKQRDDALNGNVLIQAELLATKREIERLKAKYEPMTAGELEVVD